MDCVRRGVMHGPRGHDRRYRVFENQLFLIVGFEHHGVLVEALNAARQLHATEEVNGDYAFFFARIIEKAILYVLRWFVHLRFPLPGHE